MLYDKIVYHSTGDKVCDIDLSKQYVMQLPERITYKCRGWKPKPNTKLIMFKTNQVLASNEVLYAIRINDEWHGLYSNDIFPILYEFIEDWEIKI